MNRDGHESVTFFIGPEVEKTPAFAKKTLFVVGYQDTAEIEKYAREQKAPHIFLGANHSFDASFYTDHFAKTWDDQITYLLDKGFWVTLDYQAHQHEQVLKILNPGIWQSRLFVPLLGVRIPKIETSSVNLTVKIDDIDFKATNPGVWCMHFKEVTDSNRFTDWNEYESDSAISHAEPVAKVVVEAVRKVTSIDVTGLTEEQVDGVVNEFKDVSKSVVLNDSELGLDPNAKSLLKPEPTEATAKPVPVAKVALEEVYADGATKDPVADEAKKTKAKKQTNE